LSRLFQQDASMTEVKYEWRGYTTPALLRQFADSGSRDHAALCAAALDAAGSFAGICWNADGSVTVLTDHSGSIAVYYAIVGDRVHAGFHAAEVAEQCGRLELDPISVVDFAVNQTVCFPHTLFQRVFVAPPGAVSTLNSTGIQVDIYYEPQEVKDQGTVSEWAEQLREAVRRSLELGLEGRRRIKVLFSGGEDSRAVVALIPRSLECTLVTFADSENREVRLARRAAMVLGRPFEWVQRAEGFYRQDLCARAALLSGAFDARHTHAWGVLGQRLRDADAIVGGYNADSVVKSMYMRSRLRGFGGLGPEKLVKGDAPSTVRGEDPMSYPAWVSHDLASAAAERRGQHGARLRKLRPRSAGSWDSLWPQGSHRLAYGHCLAARAIGPRVVEPFLDAQVYRLAAVMPDRVRIDRRVFRAAFNPVMGWSGWLPSSSGRIPALGGYVGRAVELAIKGGRAGFDFIAQQAARVTGGHYSEQGAWSRERYGFAAKAGEFLNPQQEQGLQTLLECISPSNSGKLGKNPRSVDEHLEGVPIMQRLRIIQAACLIDSGRAR
jgi:hypothetical protein